DKEIGRKANGERVETYNLTLVGYAPLEDPEVAFSVVVPWVHDDKTGINGYIGREIMDAYFDLKNKEVNGETPKDDKDNKNKDQDDE
ncbi:penicillin-binding transpeptidase domain-containing protein, partial [Bacillus thuringiensis]